jgi:hypothetical protein
MQWMPVLMFLVSVLYQLHLMVLECNHNNNKMTMGKWGGKFENDIRKCLLKKNLITNIIMTLNDHKNVNFLDVVLDLKCTICIL